MSSAFLVSDSASLGLGAPKRLLPPNILDWIAVDTASLSVFAPNSEGAVVVCEPKVNPPPGGLNEKEGGPEFDFSAEEDSDGLAPKLNDGIVVEGADVAPETPKEKPPAGGFGMPNEGGVGTDGVVILVDVGFAGSADVPFISTSVDVAAFALASMSPQCLA